MLFKSLFTFLILNCLIFFGLCHRPRRNENSGTSTNTIIETGNTVFCGGFAGIECPRDDWVCVPNPDESSCVAECGGADCGGVCARGPHGICNTITGESCDDNGLFDTCIDDEFDSCNSACYGADCISHCYNIMSTVFCGGIAGIECPLPSIMTCIDDPSDDCNPECGGSDCSGICVVLDGNTCGGITGDTSCSDSKGPYFECMEDSTDGCNTECGGADCGGVCARVVYR